MDLPSNLKSNTGVQGALEEKRRPLAQRMITGIATAIVAYLLDFLPGTHLPQAWAGFPFALGIGIISIIAVSEFYAAVRRQGAEPSEPLGLIACVAFQLLAWHGEGRSLDPILPLFLTMLVLAIMIIELVKPKHKPILNIGSTLLGGIYCGWLFSYLVLLHEAKLPLSIPVAGTTPGEWLVLAILSITALNDSGGLFAGKIFGRNKLAPNISPSKTWEGAIGGIIVSCVVGAAFGVLLKISIIGFAAIGGVLAVVGLVGDLCESAMKRELGVKDFGVILPGHGGILDRVDSILFVAPVGYYLIEFLLKH
jgi:phosphatidate cytidylyltransferase